MWQAFRVLFYGICFDGVLEKPIIYTPVIQHSNKTSPFPIGNSFTNGGFSMAMLDYQRVYIFIFTYRIHILDTCIYSDDDVLYNVLDTIFGDPFDSMPS